MSIQTNAGFLDSIPVGCAMDWFTDTAPINWMICQGQAISRTTYAKLFAILGTTYGVGDGTTTFNLPDFRGRTAVSKSTSGMFSSLGTKTGSETITLTTANLPSHTHSITDNGHTHSITDNGHIHGITDPGHSHIYTQTEIHISTDFDRTFTSQGIYTGQYNAMGTGSATTGISINSHNTGILVNNNRTGISVNSTGSGNSVNNIQPSLVCNKIIKVL